MCEADVGSAAARQQVQTEDKVSSSQVDNNYDAHHFFT
jgi:hypothetical protein